MNKLGTLYVYVLLRELIVNMINCTQLEMHGNGTRVHGRGMGEGLSAARPVHSRVIGLASSHI